MKLFLRVCPDMRPCLTSSGDQFLIGRNIALSFPLRIRGAGQSDIAKVLLLWCPARKTRRIGRGHRSAREDPGNLLDRLVSSSSSQFTTCATVPELPEMLAVPL